jgi:hypothetical protein
MRFRNPVRVANDSLLMAITQGFKANPGLEFANAFSVKANRPSSFEKCIASH